MLQQDIKMFKIQFNRKSITRKAAGLLLGCALTVTLAATAEGKKRPYPLRDMKECSPRGGLPNFFAKLKAGKNVIIAYLGGSITEQNGWRVQSCKWFRKQFPKAKVSGINAAIGGTGSSLGVFRIDHDVFRFKPDLLFVEFAVNDGNAPPKRIYKSMEGIVRKTWKKFPDCDICFVYTLTYKNIKTLQAGKMQRSASAMEKLADYYNIPTIHMGVKIVELVSKDKMVMKANKSGMSRVSGDELNKTSKMATDKNGKIPFARDGVHPYPDTGHVLYTAAIARSMSDIEKSGKTGSHKLSSPMDRGNWERARMLPLTKAKLEGFVKLPKSSKLVKKFRRRIGDIWMGKPGATLSFKFKGTRAAIYDLVGPDCGYLEISLDGKKRVPRRIDAFCHYHRLSQIYIGGDLPDKEHSVVIRVLDKPVPKDKILFKKHLPDFKKNPKKYAGTNWYAGGIFIIGKLL